MTRTYVVISLIAVLSVASVATAANVYTNTTPVKFMVMDMVPFNGQGDTGPFTYGMVIRGTQGEERSMAEFNLSDFSVPAGEEIVEAIFTIWVDSDYVGGLGCPYGQLPNNIEAYGYTGNGAEDLSDFQAGDGVSLGNVVGSTLHWGQAYTFNVTDYITNFVASGQTWAGLRVQTDSIGGVMLLDGVAYPRLTISTATVPEPSALALLGLGALSVLRRR